MMATRLDSLIAGEYSLEPGVVYHGCDPAMVERVCEQLSRSGIRSMIHESWVGGGEGVVTAICVYHVSVATESTEVAQRVLSRFTAEPRPNSGTPI